MTGWILLGIILILIPAVIIYLIAGLNLLEGFDKKKGKKNDGDNRL